MDVTKQFRGVRLEDADWQALAELAHRLSTPEKRVTASDLVREAVSGYLKLARRPRKKKLSKRRAGLLAQERPL